MSLRSCLAAAVLLGTASAALAETPEGAAARLDAFLDRFDGIDPGYAVVVVTADEILLDRADGVRQLSTGAPMTSATPIYVASQTKAYMGLVAAWLDENGIVALDSTIADHWPDIALPEGVDPADWTLRHLITHQVPISVDHITFLEAYALRIEPQDYPAMIARHGTAREPGYDYDNLGYNIYAAIVEDATGRTWQDWLDQVIFDPLGMETSSARTSDFALDTLSWNHVWGGEDAGWTELRPKTDGMMQSAGGLVVSPGDMAAWLQLQLRGEGPAGSGITASMIETAHTSFAHTHMEDGRNAIELPCSGYALGWNICDYNGHTLYFHGGGYVGTRTMMAFSPDLGVGIAAFSNADSMTGWLTSRTAMMYFQYLTEDETAERMADLRVDIFPDRVERQLQARNQRIDGVRAEPQWAGWNWRPDARELAAYAGRYTNGDGYTMIDIALRDGVLHGALGDFRTRLEPATPDLFGAHSFPMTPPDPWQFERNAAGVITALVVDGERLVRTD
jgi:CubicO group peptidase (beta-lactamase class C family)